MSEEGEKKIEELLKKLEQFSSRSGNIPLVFQAKPHYVEVVEKEIEKPTLQKGKYMRVPYNPITEPFSEPTLYYFLAQDGMLKKYPNLGVSKIGSSSCIYVVSLMVSKIGEDDHIYILHLGKSYVFIVRTIYSEVDDLFIDAYSGLADELEKKFGAKLISEICDNNGLFGFLGPKTEHYTIENMNKIMMSTVDEPWTKDTIAINISKINKIYPVVIYYKRKDDRVLVYIPAFIMQDLLEFALINYFKEKKA